MKRFLIVFFFLLVLFPITINAESFDNYIVMDMDSKRVFTSLDENKKVLPASTTKIMTLILAIENSNLEKIVTVGDEILTMDGSNIYIRVNEQILMQDLLYGMILRSGNDAAMTVAKTVGGDINSFVRLMNEKKDQLGMHNTIYNNPTGLDDNEMNYSSMKDLAILYSYGYKNKTFRQIVGSKKYKTTSSSKSYLFNNRMKLLEMYDKATGGKTGYTKKAGRLLVSSASNKNLNLVIASKGNTYGYEEHIMFYEDIFKNYKNYKLLDKDKFKLKNYYIKNSFIYPLSIKEKDKVTEKMVFSKDKKIGYIKIFLDNKLIHEEKMFRKNTSVSFFDKLKNLLMLDK